MFEILQMRIHGPHATAVDPDLERLKVTSICRILVIILIYENSISIKNFVVKCNVMKTLNFFAGAARIRLEMPKGFNFFFITYSIKSIEISNL